MDNDNSRVSADLFYDDDDMEAMVDAANRSYYDPKTPFAPVLGIEHGSKSQGLRTTLSGLPLGSDDCTKASKAFMEALQTELVGVEAEEPQLSNNEEQSMSMEMDQQRREETLTTRPATLNQSAPPSFINAAYFFREAKERLKQDEDAPPDLDDQEMVDERNDENKLPSSS